MKEAADVFCSEPTIMKSARPAYCNCTHGRKSHISDNSFDSIMR